MAVEWVREESRATAADRAFENFERLAKSLAARREVTAGAEAAHVKTLVHHSSNCSRAHGSNPGR